MAPSPSGEVGAAKPAESPGLHAAGARSPAPPQPAPPQGPREVQPAKGDAAPPEEGAPTKKAKGDEAPPEEGASAKAPASAEGSDGDAPAVDAPVLEGSLEIVPQEPPEPPPPPPWGAITILGKQVEAGEVRELHLPISEYYSGTGVEIPVVVVRGDKEGKTLCLTAGVHGDELNGVEIVREVVDQIRARGLAGTLIAVPIVNLHGFQNSSRYLPDRRDLNRFFPGNPTGNSASRIAHQVFEGVIRHCDALIDLHTGSFHRSNLPQVRADLREPRNLALAKAFGATVIVHNRGGKGTLRRAAQEMGIPSIIYEAGEPMRFQSSEIKRGIIGIRNVLFDQGMIRGSRVSLGEQRAFYETRWVRAERGGILVNEVGLGDEVRQGDILGTITDPIRKAKSVVISPYRGRVIGIVLAPVMIPGYAAFHIGIPGSEPVDDDDWMEQDHPE